MAKYFNLKELTYSSTAKKHNIDNTPTEEIKEHIEELMEFLDDVREKWGSAIIVNSGYRCPKLNEKAGGAKTSGHLSGWAADIVPANNQKAKFFEFLQEYVKDKDFDELIFEKNAKGSVWIHFALKSIQCKQRRKIKTLQVK